MKDMVIEELKEVHLPQVLEIYNHYVLHSTATFHLYPLSVEEMKRLVFFSNPRYRTFVLLGDEGMAGYCLLNQHKVREAYDDTAEVSIYLHPDFTGRGLGAAALQYIEGYAQQVGMHVLVATICGENHASIQLFEKNGYFKCAHYQEVGRKFERYLDLVAYQKIL